MVPWKSTCLEVSWISRQRMQYSPSWLRRWPCLSALWVPQSVPGGAGQKAWVQPQADPAAPVGVLWEILPAKESGGKNVCRRQPYQSSQRYRRPIGSESSIYPCRTGPFFPYLQPTSLFLCALLFRSLSFPSCESDLLCQTLFF